MSATSRFNLVRLAIFAMCLVSTLSNLRFQENQDVPLASRCDKQRDAMQPKRFIASIFVSTGHLQHNQLTKFCSATCIFLQKDNIQKLRGCGTASNPTGLHLERNPKSEKSIARVGWTGQLAMRARRVHMEVS